MHFPRRRILSCVGALAIAIAGAGTAAAETTLRFAHYGNIGDTVDVGAHAFKKAVEEATGGEVKISIHPAYELGNDPALLDGARLGTIDIASTGNPFYTRFAPELNVLDLPFLFKSYEHAYKVLDGDIGRELMDGLEKHQLKGLSLWEIGFRNVTNNVRPVSKPADLAGLKLRTTPNPAHVQAFRIMGAIPTPMPFNEVYLALQTGTVDGQENPVVTIFQNRLHEVQKHMSMTGHAYTAAPVVMNLRRFRSLTEAQQKAVLDAAQVGAEAMRANHHEIIEKSLQQMIAGGMQVVREPDQKAFQEAVAAETRKDYVAKFGSGLLDRIVAAGN
jgi:TRAP-type transport system periplasmic protein